MDGWLFRGNSMLTNEVTWSNQLASIYYCCKCTLQTRGALCLLQSYCYSSTADSPAFSALVHSLIRTPEPANVPEWLIEWESFLDEVHGTGVFARAKALKPRGDLLLHRSYQAY